MSTKKPDSAYKVRGGNLPLQYKQHRKEYLNTVDEVFSCGDLIDRRDLAEFEKKIARFVGTKYAVGVHSGTHALSFSMQAAGIKPGDEVITVAHTFMASISVICQQGATPVLVDVGEDFNINPDLIEAALTPRTRAIEPVHLNGRLCDMERILEIAKKHNLIVIEDAAQALGAKLKMKSGKWKMAGSFGLTGCFSLYPFKILGAFGDAGVVTTDNEEVATAVRRLRYNGQDRATKQFYWHGETALLDNVQAALLNVKLKYLPQWVLRRREIAKIYHMGLKEVSGVRIPNFSDTRYYDVYQNYVIRAQKRDELQQYLDTRGVQSLVSWPIPMYKQPVMQPNRIVLHETEKICKEVISLPMYPELENAQVRYVIQCVKEFYTHG